MVLSYIGSASFEDGTCAGYRSVIGLYGGWCQTNGYVAFPIDTARMDAYMSHMLDELHIGTSVGSTANLLKRVQVALNFPAFTDPPGLIRKAKKCMRVWEDVIPFPTEAAVQATGQGTDLQRNAAYAVLLGCRLMLRPGEFAKIKTTDVRNTPGGADVRIVGRKSDKVNRFQPWHFIACRSKLPCLACWVKRAAFLIAKDIEVGHPIFVDHSGMPPTTTEHLARLFISVYRSVLGDAECPPRFVGKSARVGGAMAAARAGVPELSIRITGDWRSEALLRYIGGIIAERSGMTAAIMGDIRPLF